MPLAFEFVDAHPQFYKAFVTDLFTAQYHANHGAINCDVVAGGRNWGEGDLKYFRMFMQLDIKKYSEGKIKQQLRIPRCRCPASEESRRKN